MRLPESPPQLDVNNLKPKAAAVLAMLALVSARDVHAQDPAVFYIGGAALVAVLPGYLFDLPQPDADRSFLQASIGNFDAVDHENRALDVQLEYQPGRTWQRIKPLFGIAANSDGSVYGWIAAAHDFHLAESFVVKVSTGPAFYVGSATGKNLGSAGVLRSGFDIGYRFPGEARLTLSFHHMSHGELLNPELNPGTEVIALNLDWPLR